MTAAVMAYLGDLTSEERTDPAQIEALIADLQRAEDEMVEAARNNFRAKSRP